MSLAGLLTILDDDPQLRSATARAQTGADLVAPPTLRPVLAAALASRPGDAVPATPPREG